MKTSIKTLATICAVVISLTANAQHRSRGNEGNQNHGNNNSNNAMASVDRHGHHGYGNYGNNGHHYGNYHNHNNWGSGINIQFGVFPFWGNGNGYNYYGNSYANNIRRVARNSIRQSANVIGNALEYSDWNDTYSPWLAKAIRHQEYAKQLYFWGDYAGALNHAERAGYLAWTTLNYFNDGLGYNDSFNDGNYPNPYSDPNNPYYRKNNVPVPNSNNSNTSNSNNNDDSDFGYKKNVDNTPSTEKKADTKSSQKEIKQSDLDTTLPESKMSDKELLKTSVKDLDVE